MINFFSKRLNKKGFTLAELLIVIAIIAILVAIAVPMFASQLNKARVVRDQANIRAVKSAAITKVLSGDDPLPTTTWYATGAVTADGDITSITIETGTPTPSVAGQITYPGNITVQITAVDLFASESGEG